MKRNTYSSMIIFVIVLLVSACSSPGTQAPEIPTATSAPQSSQVQDQDGLIDALRTDGATVELGEPVEQAFFTVPGQILKVNDKDVQVFEYESAEALEADAAQVASDGGSIGTNMVMWVEAPHFFKSGRVLVLYVGEDQGVIDLLKGALGEQFAGR
jgi:hypothetical protein